MEIEAKFEEKRVDSRGEDAARKIVLKRSQCHSDRKGKITRFTTA